MKQTEIGEIPEDWDLVRLGEIGENFIGLTYSPSSVNTYGTLVLRSSNVQNGQLAFKDNVYVKMDLPSRVITKKNDILICVRNGSRQLIGKCALINEKAEGSAFGAFMTVYRTDYFNFIFHQFNSEIIQKQIRVMMGATINQITNKDLKSFIVPLPRERKEQDIISTVLADMDNLIQATEQLINKKQLIKTATMQNLLTGKIRLAEFDTKKTKSSELGEIPSNWDIDIIENVADITTGNKNTQDKIETGLYPFFVRSQTVERINTYSFDGEGVLTAGDGVGTGKVFHYINGKFDFHQRVYLIHKFSDKLDGYYFYIYFSNKFYDRIMSMTAKSSVDSVRREMIAEMKILLPSKPEQSAIAKILSDMEIEITELNKRLAKLNDIKQGLMQNLLTGKIRLTE